VFICVFEPYCLCGSIQRTTVTVLLGGLCPALFIAMIPGIRLLDSCLRRNDNLFNNRFLDCARNDRENLGGHIGPPLRIWIPAFAGMTR